MHQLTDSDYMRILTDFPDKVTKEQFYRLCHVSKRVASYYLEQGFLPCEKRKSKTHKYLIKTVDIVTFLKKRQEDPTAFGVPVGTSRKPTGTITAKITLPKESAIDLARWGVFLTANFADFLDVCKVQEITRLCGYSKETVLKWCETGKFIYFNINRAYQIPKKAFIDFMASAEFTGIVQKSARHNELLRAFGTQAT
ncbi:MAG: helix-turn-helix domain-containing protein [Clostridium sp.]|jgi:hypothetical protein|nr:helix-turn-helix domain-containing protein [Clostridium sp.]